MSLFEFKANEVPAIRIASAISRNKQKDILIVVGGGLGDRICAIPTVKYILDHYKDCKVSLMCDTPEIFNPLPFDKVYSDIDDVDEDDHLAFYTYNGSNLANQFFNPNLMNSVDFASVSAIRGQLPDSYRRIMIYPNAPTAPSIINIATKDRYCLVHVGKSWPSRTLPAHWYWSLITNLQAIGRIPVLIGKNCVDLDELPRSYSNIIDLRDKTSLSEFLWLCKNADALITNDSSPLHAAACGETKIAFVATCRGPDFLTHHRVGGYGWRMKSFYKDKMWEKFITPPNSLDFVDITQVPEGTKIEDYIPDPIEIVKWIESLK